PWLRGARRGPPPGAAGPGVESAGAVWADPYDDAGRPRAPPAASDRPELSAAGPPHVLVVDDDEPIAAALRRALEYEGFRVSLARDGYAAVEQVQREAPDL